MKLKPLTPELVEMLLENNDKKDDKVVNDLVASINDLLVDCTIKKCNFTLHCQEKSNDRWSIHLSFHPTTTPRIGGLGGFPSSAQIKKAVSKFEKNGWKVNKEPPFKYEFVLI
jgi:hypothetical protein